MNTIPNTLQQLFDLMRKGHITTDEFAQIASAEFGCSDEHICRMVAGR